MSGLQALRMVSGAAAFGWVILVFPATVTAAGPILRPSAQWVWLLVVILATAAAAFWTRRLQRRDSGRTGSAQDVAAGYRERFLQQIATAQLPGFLAFLFALFVRPYPALAILIGVIATAALVWSFAPTERNLDRLQGEVGAGQGARDVRGLLDEMYTWRP
ncbi:MAG TPA: hypothetical protein VM324_15485 [Egibacteraceae bacterium]|nr:hypothetical protein [Egibacteraceae bacterium]